MRPKKLLIALAIVVVLLGGCAAPSASPVTTDKLSLTPTPVPTLTSIRGVPSTSACAITSPPPSMVGINTHTEVYGAGADPDMITLGPKLGITLKSSTGYYATKHSMAWELKIHGTPVLAPIDMVLVGFQNNSVT
ncbi:MAG: hypothetical protein ACYDG5_01100, partial [Dehalococcoidales bacterium]